MVYSIYLYVIKHYYINILLLNALVRPKLRMNYVRLAPKNHKFRTFSAISFMYSFLFVLQQKTRTVHSLYTRHLSSASADVRTPHFFRDESFGPGQNFHRGWPSAIIRNASAMHPQCICNQTQYRRFIRNTSVLIRPFQRSPGKKEWGAHLERT